MRRNILFSPKLFLIAGVFCAFGLSFNTAHGQTIQQDPVYQDIIVNTDPSEIALDGDDPISTCAEVFDGILTLPISGYCGERITEAADVDNYPFPVSPGDTGICQVTAAGAFGITLSGNYNCVLIKGGGGGWVTYEGCAINYGSLQACSAIKRTYDRDGNLVAGATDSEGPLETAGQTTFGSIYEIAGDIGGKIIVGVSWIILQLASWLLGLAGTLFNWVMVKTVFGFSTLIGNSPGVLTAWSILRDIANIALLFGFIFVGIAMILDLHSFPAKKALPRLIIFAILMNFSLFIAGAVVDASNGLSAVLYAQSNTDQCVEGNSIAGSTVTQEECSVNYGIAGHILQATGLSSTYSVTQGVGPVAMVGLAMFTLIGAFVLFAGAIMLIIRAVVLTFLMVLAPIGFAALAIPSFEKQGMEWWNRLIHQSFFAPIFLLLIFVSLKITDGFAATTTRRSLAGAVTHPEASVMGVIMIFGLVIGFLIFSLIAAKRFGAMGADFAMNTVLKAGKFGGRVALKPVTATGGVLGRNIVGRGAAAIQQRYEARMGQEPNSRLGRWTQAALKNNFLGIDSGIAGTLGGAQKARFGSGSSFKESKDRKKERGETFEKEGRRATNREDLNRALAMAPGTDRDDRVAEVLERMSTKEVEELNELKKSNVNLDQIAQNLSPEKFAALLKDGSGLNETQKQKAREARFKNLKDSLDVIKNPASSTAQVSQAEDAIRQFSAKDLQNAPTEWLADATLADTLSDSQREDIGKSGTVSPAVRRIVRAADPAEKAKAAYKGIAAGTATIATVQADVKKLNPKKAAQLSAEMLRDKSISDHLTINQLRAIVSENKLSEPDRQRLARNIGSRALSDPQLTKYMNDPKNGTFADYFTP